MKMESGNNDIRYVMRSLIREIRKREERMSESEEDESWLEFIELRNNLRKKSQRRRLTTVFAASCAAAVIGCIFIPVFRGRSSSHHETSTTMDLEQYVQLLDSSHEEIVLMMEGGQNISLNEENPSIKFASDGTLTVNSDTIDYAEEQQGIQAVNRLVTPKGKRTHLTLADGSSLWVNSGTNVVFPAHFSADRREIFVEGEVYIDVKRNEHVPFFVRTKDFDVQVLGTSFNVSAYPSEESASVVLVKGRVNVENKEHRHVHLSPGQMVTVIDGEPCSPRRVDVSQYISWIDNMLIYDDRPLSDVFHKLTLYYGKEFKIDPDVAVMRVTGKLDLKEDLDPVLNTISYSTPIKYTKMSNGKIRVSKD